MRGFGGMQETEMRPCVAARRLCVDMVASFRWIACMANSNHTSRAGHSPAINFIGVLLVFGFAIAARAELRLNALFSDNMVLQQDASIPVWGWADEGQTVKVSFKGQTASVVAKNGKWMVRLKNLKPGAPEVLTVSAGSQTVICTNVLVGEVWVCSGQSNMQYAMRQSHEPDKDIAGATNSQIRLFYTPMVKSDAPLTNTTASWQTLSPGAVKEFSAVAYYFGRELQARRGVPVGLIQTAWGGSPAEVWMSEDALKGNARYEREILEPGRAAFQDYQRKLAAFEKARDEAKQTGEEFKTRAPRLPWKPTEL